MPKIDALDQGSSSQRDALNHQAIEDYLKTIYMLAEAESPVSTSRIAEAREVKPGSVTSMLQRLAKLNLVDYEKHYGVTLTESGEKIALEVIRHHRLLELYLSEALGFGWDEVHEQAELLEHVISEKLEERIAAVLGNPTLDPHGDPIPAKDGTIIQQETRPLTAVSPGETVLVTRIPDDGDSERLRYLAELGLRPGTEVMITAVAPFDGPLTLTIEGQSKVVGFTIAQSVLVSDPASH
ncbi:MAG: metal-dependent transcriptional regulator [Aquificales bacterium]|nr:metal-dependent transcriptional regulator [Aquificales bacterium]